MLNFIKTMKNKINYNQRIRKFYILSIFLYLFITSFDLGLNEFPNEFNIIVFCGSIISLIIIEPLITEELLHKIYISTIT